ncbi:hypothetical protein SeLEV6574_g06682 [Synchytrium endobioticum]|uniref:Uncharacterized protein n=1 Tax=Synchytrium endobioticum TaxID=286115 RepID=A0A507CKQ9_9FUNG|nr:hypothetical protein SeLEV6574_g06682 [Synchytrium endobioticum]
MQEQTIQILVAELDEIQARVVQPTDTSGIAQKNKDYKLAKTAVEVGQRDLRVFMRDAKTRYVNVVVANPATVTGGPLATSSSSQVIKIEDPSKFSGKMADYNRWRFEARTSSLYGPTSVVNRQLDSPTSNLPLCDV